MIDGKRSCRVFKNKKDVWDVIDLIIDETKEINLKEGKSFDVAQSVISQIHFFSCPNILFSADVQRDIERYLYCEKFNVPPFTGEYGKQPYKWVMRSFYIKSAIAKKEKRDFDVNSKQNTNTI